MPKRAAVSSRAGYGTRDNLRFVFIETAFEVAPKLRQRIEAVPRPRLVWADGTVLMLCPRRRKAVQGIARRFNLSACAWAVDCLCKWPDRWRLSESEDPPARVEGAPSPPPFFLQHDGLGPEDDLHKWVNSLKWSFGRRLEVYLRGDPGNFAGALERLPLRLSRKAPSHQTFADLAQHVVLGLPWRDAFGFDRTRSSAEEEYRTRHAAALRLADALGLNLPRRPERKP